MKCTELWVCIAVLVLLSCTAVFGSPKFSDEHIVFQTDYGDIEMVLYPEVAPKTCDHIMKLAKMGGYNTNHFFRVDKGFVAQTADVAGGRLAPIDTRQETEAKLTVPLEVTPSVKHDKRGLLSMARFDDPNSGGSSFSITLGPAPHLDMQYTIFGEVVRGDDTLAKLETLETRTEGIFVMPKDRITIHSSYVFDVQPSHCRSELADLRSRYQAQAQQLEKLRASRLP